MSTETVFTDFQIDNIAASVSAARASEQNLRFARAIEQAVLQSSEVQALRKDAERYRWLRGQCEKLLGGLTICEVGLFELKPWSGVDPDRNIDAAMEQQK